MLNQSIIVHQIAVELNVWPAQVESAIELLDGGDTVPFILRYRKEVKRRVTILKALKSKEN